MAEVSGPGARPGVVSGAVRALLIGGVMLAAGGLVMAFMDLDTLREGSPATTDGESIRSFLRLYRGLGALFVGAAIALIALTVRAGRRDIRSRRAVMVLALTVTVVVAGSAVFVGTQILALVSLVPIIVGTLLISRPVALEWFAAADDFGVTPDA